MPYKTVWIKPGLFLKHRGVRVFHLYKDDNVDQGARRFSFTVSLDCNELDSGCEDRPCRHVFDVHDLSTWQAPPQPPYCTGPNKTPENRAAWDRYWKLEATAIRAAIVAALRSGELTRKGLKP